MDWLKLELELELLEEEEELEEEEIELELQIVEVDKKDVKDCEEVHRPHGVTVGLGRRAANAAARNEF